MRLIIPVFALAAVGLAWTVPAAAGYRPPAGFRKGSFSEVFGID